MNNFGSKKAKVEKVTTIHIKLRVITFFIGVLRCMKENRIGDLENYRPWIETRFDPNILPKHKILSRQLHEHNEPTLTIHTAGQNIVWEIPIREVAFDHELLRNMDESDRSLVRWIYENDCIVENYNYKAG